MLYSQYSNFDLLKSVNNSLKPSKCSGIKKQSAGITNFPSSGDLLSFRGDSNNRVRDWGSNLATGIKDKIRIKDRVEGYKASREISNFLDALDSKPEVCLKILKKMASPEISMQVRKDFVFKPAIGEFSIFHSLLVSHGKTDLKLEFPNVVKKLDEGTQKKFLFQQIPYGGTYLDRALVEKDTEVSSELINMINNLGEDAKEHCLKIRLSYPEKFLIPFSPDITSYYEPKIPLSYLGVAYFYEVPEAASKLIDMARSIKNPEIKEKFASDFCDSFKELTDNEKINIGSEGRKQILSEFLNFAVEVMPEKVAELEINSPLNTHVFNEIKEELYKNNKLIRPDDK